MDNPPQKNLPGVYEEILQKKGKETSTKDSKGKYISLEKRIYSRDQYNISEAVLHFQDDIKGPGLYKVRLGNYNLSISWNENVKKMKIINVNILRVTELKSPFEVIKKWHLRKLVSGRTNIRNFS